METIYFLVGAVTVAVVFTMVWLLRVVSHQIKQIQNLEKGLENVVLNDITESQIRAIVDSRVDKYADQVSSEFERTTTYVEGLHKSSEDYMGKIIRHIDDTKRDLELQINSNRVTNTRRVTDGGLQSEY